MKADLKVVIVAGGLSHERDVSIRSGIRVQNTLRSRGITIDVIDFDSGFLPALDGARADLVFPLVHGAAGEDGSLAALLEVSGHRFVGSSSAAARVASDKASMKAVLDSQGILTPRGVCLPQHLFRQQGAAPILDAIVARFGLPLVVKPAMGGSALGISVVKSAAELPTAMVDAFAYHDSVLVETHITGTDLAIGVVSVKQGPALDGIQELLDSQDTPVQERGDGGVSFALPIVEAVTDDGDYDFDARYNPGRTEYFVPARLSAAEAAQAQQLALRLHGLFGLGQLSRIDMLRTAAGELYVLDINVSPGMTDTSLFPQAASELGRQTGRDGFADILQAVCLDTIDTIDTPS